MAELPEPIKAEIEQIKIALRNLDETVSKPNKTVIELYIARAKPACRQAGYPTELRTKYEPTKYEFRS